MRVLGAILVIASSTIAGWIYSLLLKKRLKILSNLIQCFQWLETEVGYATFPLAEAFSRIGGRIQEETKLLFSGFTDELKELQGLTADEAWQRSLAKCQEHLSLHHEDWALLENFGRTLGNTDQQHQLGAIRQTLEKLKQQEMEAAQNREKNERLYRYLGIAAGVLLVLIFY
ncbi:MAG TPA: stage III sporulation protein AB [Firmicutes bacterium]|jgi:stage III sporulation protein AB|nr:stage III sporulation protein AB [Bacillota bacterium]